MAECLAEIIMMNMTMVAKVWRNLRLIVMMRVNLTMIVMMRVNLTMIVMMRMNVTIDNSDAEVESDDDIDDEVDDDYHCNKFICFYDIHVIDRCRGNLIDPLCQYVCQICHPFRRL